MKKLLITIIIFGLTVPISLFGQGGSEGRLHWKNYEAIRAERIAFFTEKIGLAPEEAEKFWPLFNEFQDKKDKIIDKRRNAVRKLSEAEGLTTAEIENNTNDIIESFKEEAELIEKYHLKFKKILPIEKVGKIYVAEHEFKSYLLHKIKGNKNGKK